jgi:hypothetical protein
MFSPSPRPKVKLDTFQWVREEKTRLDNAKAEIKKLQKSRPSDAELKTCPLRFFPRPYSLPESFQPFDLGNITEVTTFMECFENAARTAANDDIPVKMMREFKAFVRQSEEKAALFKQQAARSKLARDNKFKLEAFFRKRARNRQKREIAALNRQWTDKIIITAEMFARFVDGDDSA